MEKVLDELDDILKKFGWDSGNCKSKKVLFELDIW
jgi:hypothetical protein